MAYGESPSLRPRDGLSAACLLCLCLLLPTLAFAYGGGGGGGDVGGGGGSGGPQVQSFPGDYGSSPYQTGIEGMPVEPAPGEWGGYYTPEGRPTRTPGPKDTPWYNTPEYQFVEKVVTNQLQDKAIAIVLASNPELLAAVKAAQAVNGVYNFTKDVKQKLDKAKKDYQKALIGTMGSGIQAPPADVPELSSYTPGGGPAPLHESIFMQ